MKKSNLFSKASALPVILMGAIIILSCSSDSGGDSVQSFKVDISGSVVDSKSKAALSGISIDLYSNERIVKNTRSGEDGVFSFSDLEVGSYSLHISAAGYEEYKGKDTLIKNKGYKETISLVPSATTFLTIKNESSFTLENIVWNGIEFGAMAPNATPVRKSVGIGNAQISFYMPDRGVNARTVASVEVKQDADVEYSIKDDIDVEEINPALVGIFDNRETLKLIQTAKEPKPGNVNVTNVNQTSATFSSSITEAGNPRFTEKGFCYSKELGDLKIEYNCIVVEGEFTKTIENLTDNAKYYVVAYADNYIHQRQYSNIDSLTTKDGTPIVSAPTVISVGYDTARVQASIAFAGNPSYATAENGERGFCVWTDTLTINNHCEAATGTNSSYSKTFSELNDSTKYYVKAYIDNGKHPKIYGSVQTFTTYSGMPNVRIDPATNITSDAALLHAAVLTSANPNYTEKGFCYSTTSNSPSKNTSSATCVPVSGTATIFEYEIESIELLKTYYVLAYIENSYGIVYSYVETFYNDMFIDSRDGKAYKVKDISSTNSGIIWFMDDLAYNGKSGYTWEEANTVCPAGWRLPSNSDWDALWSVWSANRVSFTASIGAGYHYYWMSGIYGTNYVAVKLSSSSLSSGAPSPEPANSIYNYAVRCVKN